jgi:hypothetical protein
MLDMRHRLPTARGDFLGGPAARTGAYAAGAQKLLIPLNPLTLNDRSFTFASTRVDLSYLIT